MFILFFSVQYLWLLTRDRNPSDSVLQTARNAIEQYGLSYTITRPTNQNNCP